MLRSLKIRNYALIESLDVDFPAGLSIITGETGAGKSIMLGALSMLAGNRADAKAILREENKCIVEAEFSEIPEALSLYLADSDIEPLSGNELILRREISPSGRSRAFVNDAPVPLKTLADISAQLFDIHSQHQNLLLGDSAIQLKMLDAVAENSILRENYTKAYREYVELSSELKALRMKISRNKDDEEFIRFRLDQLEKLRPKRGELPALERRYELLSSAQDLREGLSEAFEAFADNETGAIHSLYIAKESLSRLQLDLLEDDADHENRLTSRLERILIEAKDISETIEDLSSEIECDPATLLKLEKRISAIYDAQRRFKVTTEDELVDIKEDLENKLNEISEGGLDTEKLEESVRIAAAELRKAGELLSASRKRASDDFVKKVLERAKPLGLPNLRFSISIERTKLGPTGGDKIDFLCSFNKSVALMQASRVASGGEIARLMLAIKSVVAHDIKLPTIIFDEVDTGVSGNIADRMGAMMKEMGDQIQVITITHLPQVASKGEAHFQVYKSDVGDKTVTHVVRLNDEDRIKAIARMLAGSEIGDAALNNARDLLGL